VVLSSSGCDYSGRGGSCLCLGVYALSVVPTHKDLAAGLAICQYDGEDAFYLFGCDANWNAVTDTWHQTVDEAKEQAEFRYKGASHTGQSVP
jgi:hypothetical protein